MDDFRSPNFPSGHRSAAISTLRRVRYPKYRAFFRRGSAPARWASGRGHKRSHEAIEINQKHPFKIQLARLVADVARVGYVHASPAVDGDVIRTVEPLVIVVVGQRADRTVALGDRNPPASTDVGPLGDDEPPANRKSCRWPARSARETPSSCRSLGQTA